MYMCDFMHQVQMWAKQQAERIQTTLSALEAEREEVQRLLDWISSTEESLSLKEQEPLPEDLEITAELITQHAVLIPNNKLFILNSQKLSTLTHPQVSTNMYDYFLLLRNNFLLYSTEEIRSYSLEDHEGE